VDRRGADFQCARAGRPSFVADISVFSVVWFNQDDVTSSSATGQCSTPAARQQIHLRDDRIVTRNFIRSVPFTTRIVRLHSHDGADEFALSLTAFPRGSRSLRDHARVTVVGENAEFSLRLIVS